MHVPTVFLSAATEDLKDWRNVLHKAFERAGCKVFTQDNSLGASSGSVMDLLRRHLDQSDFVIHLAGLAYGSEPEQAAFDTQPDFKCSYTQFEYYYAHYKGKQVIAFVCAENFPYLAYTEKGEDETDLERRRELQKAHRVRVAEGRFTGTPLEGHPDRPLSEPIADINALLQAVAAAVGTILSADRTTAIQTGLRSAMIDLTHFDVFKYAPAELIGRDGELKMLEDVWAKARDGATKRPHVLTFVALGGEGKTSLVARWAADLAHQDWPGCDAVFAWSFYNQGTLDRAAVSSDTFLAAALTFFGDSTMAASAAGGFDKGRRLAQLIGERRALLILDGVEPLQYAPTSPTPGEFKDQGLAALLKGLAVISRGLCVVTTRYELASLRTFWQTTVPMHDLVRLPTVAGVTLLRSLGVTTGSQTEFEELVEDVDGHALTLQIVGQFIARAWQGDIRRRDRVDFQKANAKIQGGHAFRAMEAYEKWLANESDESRRELALLSLLGLFDRPATTDCLMALRAAPAILGLTEPLVDVADDDWEFSLSALRDAKLLTVNRVEGSGELLTVDAHPLLREYFAQRLREQTPEAWRAAHRRLFEHLCATTHEGQEPSLEELQPLYQAVSHGCQASLHHEALDKVCQPRIWRRNELYTVRRLGAFGSDLGAIICFFDLPWRRVSLLLKEQDRAFLLTTASFCLRALGRLTEALEPLRAGLAMRVAQPDWANAAISAQNLSELELSLGELADAEKDARQSVIYAGNSGDSYQLQNSQSGHGDTLHQMGRRVEAANHFHEAEQIQTKRQPIYPMLYSTPGFKFCDLFLSRAEHSAWQIFLGGTDNAPNNRVVESCRAAGQRAARAFSWRNQVMWNSAYDSLLDIALDYLTYGRSKFYEAIFEESSLAKSHEIIHEALKVLRRAGAQDYLPLGLLTRSWLSYLEGARRGPESAQSDLDEAWEIAERGLMRLFLADIHLHRARLFFREADYPWESPETDLAAARRLIEKHGYFRRKEELEDAEAIIDSSRQ
jgi:tetratricopeptide (TPR) repeat protein